MGAFFSLATSADVDRMRFWGTFTSPTPPPADDFTIVFYAPGTSALDPSDIIAMRNVGNIGRASTGLFNTGNGHEIFRFDASFAPVALQADVPYMISLFDEDATNLGTFAWKWIDPFQGSAVFSSDMGMTWQSTSPGLAYLLFQDAVPSGQFVSASNIAPGPLVFAPAEMEAGSAGAGAPVNNASAQRFIAVTSGLLTFVEATVDRVSGGEPLKVAIRDGSGPVPGAILAEIIVPESSFGEPWPVGTGLQTFDFSGTGRSLVAGQSYFLTLSTDTALPPPDVRYRLFMQNPSFGFPPHSSIDGGATWAEVPTNLPAHDYEVGLTVFVSGAPAVPTLPGWGALVLALGLAAGGARALRFPRTSWRGGPLRVLRSFLVSVASAILLAGIPSVAWGQASIVYVDAQAGGTNDGSSWPNAFTSLSNALAVGPAEFWIAEGIYAPGNPASPQTETFNIQSGQQLYGGFAANETSRDQRNAKKHVTTLSGDIKGDDFLVGGTTLDNAYHILSFVNTDATPVIDGFTITTGIALAPPAVNGQGAGAHILNSSPTFSDCRFVDNAAHFGAAIVVNGGSPVVERCEFLGNRVIEGRGGAIFNVSSISIHDSVFDGNTASGFSVLTSAGALYNELGATMTVVGSHFLRNSALTVNPQIGAPGGAIYHRGALLEVRESSFWDNTANQGGGVALSGESLFENCVFIDNKAMTTAQTNVGGIGGALLNQSLLGNPVNLVGCVVTGNTASDDGGGLAGAAGTLATLENSIIWGNIDSTGTTLQAQLKGPGDQDVFFSTVQGLPNPGAFPGVLASDPLFIDLDGEDNTPGTVDDDVRLSAGSPVIDAGDNTAVPVSGTLDIVGNLRFLDDAGTADSGNGTAPIVDMGAHEFVGTTTASLVVNGGIASTATTDVPLDVALVGGAAVAQMRFRDDSLKWGPWQDFASTTSHSIPPIDGIRSVAGEFADADGVILASAVGSVVLNRNVIKVCAPDQAVSMDATCMGSLPDLTGNLLFVGNAPIASVTQAPAVGTPVALGESVVVTIEATDTVGNVATCAATVTGEDTTDPIIAMCVPDQTIAGGASGFASIPDFGPELVFADNCPSSITIVQAPPVATLLPNNLVFSALFQVTDAGQNTDLCFATITIGPGPGM
jgi:hypothetical protein